MKFRKSITMTLGEYLWHTMWMVMGIGLTTWHTIDYFKIQRPMDQCLEHKEQVCYVAGKVLYIQYADNGDYLMSKEEIQ